EGSARMGSPSILAVSLPQALRPPGETLVTDRTLLAGLSGDQGGPRAGCQPSPRTSTIRGGRRVAYRAAPLGTCGTARMPPATVGEGLRASALGGGSQTAVGYCCR